MKYLIFCLALYSNILLAQVERLPYDVNKVTEEMQLNLRETEKRGIEYQGIVYYVENNLKTIKAYRKDGSVKWKVRVSRYIKPAVGKKEIRYIEVKQDMSNPKLYWLFIVYAKHDFASINIETGKLYYMGAD